MARLTMKEAEELRDRLLGSINKWKDFQSARGENAVYYEPVEGE